MGTLSRSGSGLPTGVLTKDRDVIRRLYTGDPLIKRHGNDMLRPILGDDELITLITAGHETTAIAIAWGVELLVHNPGVMADARAGDDVYLDALVK
jgi:hypothetical protein